MAKGALQDAGIQAMVQADTVGGMREHLAWSGAGFQILVREEDATLARDVLTPPAGGDFGPDADSQTSVDLPVPFSPTKKQTRLVTSRIFSDTMAGMLNGYCFRSPIRSLSSEILWSLIIGSGVQQALSHLLAAGGT